MGQVLVRNLSDHALAAFRQRAKAKGTSLESELRELIERHAPFTPQERGAAARRLLARVGGGPVRSLTSDEIREGLE